MARFSIRLAFLFLLICNRLFAVENVGTGTFNETAPTGSNISNWQTGWTQPDVQPTGYTSTTGWNYVGMINGATSGPASGTYLGNGWVITAAHVGAASFVLNGTSYPVVPNSAQGITATGTTTTGTLTAPVDITLFQVSPAPALPALPFRSSDPVALSSRVVMIGFGDGAQKTNETWGYNLVTSINSYPTQLSGGPWVSNDFISLEGADSHGQNNYGNVYEVQSGDSGGADFIYNHTTKQWELAGINEGTVTATYSNGATQNGSCFVQLDTYLGQIETIITPVPADSPTMPQWALIVLGGSLAAMATLNRPRSRGRC
jgi:hypothetical protein